MKRPSRKTRDYQAYLNMSVSPQSHPDDRGLHVFSVTKDFREHQQRLNSMELRLKKLREDEERAK